MSTWSIPLDRLAEKIGANLETVVRKVTFDLFSAVVLRSPRDTGRFAANWNVSYGTADTSTSPSVDQGRGQAEAAKALTLPAGGVVYIANGLPYARVLEYGSSRQAPAGVVRITALEFSQYVQKAIAP